MIITQHVSCWEILCRHYTIFGPSRITLEIDDQHSNGNCLHVILTLRDADSLLYLLHGKQALSVIYSMTVQKSYHYRDSEEGN